MQRQCMCAHTSCSCHSICTATTTQTVQTQLVTDAKPIAVQTGAATTPPHAPQLSPAAAAGSCPCPPSLRACCWSGCWTAGSPARTPGWSSPQRPGPGAAGRSTAQHAPAGWTRRTPAAGSENPQRTHADRQKQHVAEVERACCGCTADPAQALSTLRTQQG